MCFSAEASFISSAVISGIGVLALRKSETTPQKVFAAIPLIFGVQQFLEGLVWLSLSHPDYGGWAIFATHSFLTLAWIIWPVYVPLSMRLLENREKRKKWLNILLADGIIVSGILFYVLFFNDVRAELQGHHIKYQAEQTFEFPQLFGFFYFIPIVISLFISSVNRIRIMGLVVLVSFIFTAVFYREYLISIWCFFAALSSIMVLWVVYGIKEKPKQP